MGVLMPAEVACRCGSGHAFRAGAWFPHGPFDEERWPTWRQQLCEHGGVQVGVSLFLWEVIDLRRLLRRSDHVLLELVDGWFGCSPEPEDFEPVALPVRPTHLRAFGDLPALLASTTAPFVVSSEGVVAGPEVEQWRTEPPRYLRYIRLPHAERDVAYPDLRTGPYWAPTPQSWRVEERAFPRNYLLRARTQLGCLLDAASQTGNPIRFPDPHFPRSWPVDAQI